MAAVDRVKVMGFGGIVVMVIFIFVSFLVISPST